MLPPPPHTLQVRDLFLKSASLMVVDEAHQLKVRGVRRGERRGGQ